MRPTLMVAVREFDRADSITAMTIMHNTTVTPSEITSANPSSSRKSRRDSRPPRCHAGSVTCTQLKELVGTSSRLKRRSTRPPKLEPGDRHLQAFPVDPARSHELARILRALDGQCFIHSLGVLEQAHLGIEQRHAENLRTKVESPPNARSRPPRDSPVGAVAAPIGPASPVSCRDQFCQRSDGAPDGTQGIGSSSVQSESGRERSAVAVEL